MGTGRAYGVTGNLNSDRRKLTTFHLDGEYSWGELGDWGYEIGGRIEFKPGGALQLSLSPGYERQVESRQYVDVFDGGSAATFGQRYVFAFIDYSEVSARLRVVQRLRRTGGHWKPLPEGLRHGRHHDRGVIGTGAA